ncbi:MAG: hypothetical protein QXF20_01220 [Candidatus Hadarchaeales archaeon]|nr:MAG: hypothetical protein DSO03_03270 [Hadesarchaea archaeon]
MRFKKPSKRQPVSIEEVFLEPKNQKLVVYLPPTIKELLEELARNSEVKTNTCVLYLLVKQLKELGLLK